MVFTCCPNNPKSQVVEININSVTEEYAPNKNEAEPTPNKNAAERTPKKIGTQRRPSLDCKQLSLNISQMKFFQTIQEEIQRHDNIYDKPLISSVIEDHEFNPPSYDKSSKERELIHDALRANFIFMQCSETELTTLIDAMEPLSIPEETVIISLGDVGDYFYVIQSGSVRFVVNEEAAGMIAYSGDSFGELALLYDCPRAATCIANDECRLWRVDRETFRCILVMHNRCNERDILEVLRKVDILKEVNDAELKKISRALVMKSFAKGQKIVEKGSSGDVFYIIRKGTVEITDIGLGETRYVDQELGQGSFFGERALLTGDVRAANAIAKTDCDLLCMSRDDFLEILGPLEALIEKSQDKTLLMGVPAIVQANIPNHELERLVSFLEPLTFSKNQFIYRMNEKMKPCLYLIYSGKVLVRQRSTVNLTNTEIIDAAKNGNMILSTNDYFGDETFQQHRVKSHVFSQVSVMAMEETHCKALTLESLQLVLDEHYTDTLIRKESTAKLPTEQLPQSKQEFSLSALKKHCILGCGTFGQVWLVSDTRGEKKAFYAMKIQPKRLLLEKKQVQGALLEKKIMQKLGGGCPFIIQFIQGFQDDTFLYMILKYYQGGELFTLLHSSQKRSSAEHKKKRGGLKEYIAKFYASCVFYALRYMHRRQIVYRDLKPENVMIDTDGYCVLVDLGFAKIIRDKTYTLCGSPPYMAPEVILYQGHDQSADVWSFGVLLYELIFGKTPFYPTKIPRKEIFKNICNVDYTIPQHKTVSPEVIDLIQRILVKRPTKRLGCLARGDDDIRDHVFFRDVNFEKLGRKQIGAPWRPKVKNECDLSNFIDWKEAEKEYDDEVPIPKDKEKHFKDF